MALTKTAPAAESLATLASGLSSVVIKSITDSTAVFKSSSDITRAIRIKHTNHSSYEI